MKIAYMLEIDPFIQKGVLNKVKMQCNIWANEGHCVELFVTSHKEGYVFTNWPVKVNTFTSFITKYGRIGRYINRILMGQAVTSEIKAFKPDFIYYRLNTPYLGRFKTFSNFKVFVEVNASFQHREAIVSKFLENIMNYYNFRLINDRAMGVVCIAAKIKEELIILGVEDNKLTTVSNGCLFSKIERNVSKNKAFEVTFMGSFDQPWQGLDKVFWLASKIPEIKFNIIGVLDSKTLMMAHQLPNINILGLLSFSEIIPILIRTNVGIGTLAAHRKNLFEASPLKVRDYASFKIPIILGCLDSDLQADESVLFIGNYESNVEDSLGIIKEFIVRASNKELSFNNQNRIDAVKKEQEKLNWIFGLL